MDFKTLYERIAPKLKMLARKYCGYEATISMDDLYQEMCAHLWNNFKDGVPQDLNDSYIIKGCEFHILNFLRMNREKQNILRLDEPVNDEDEFTLKDTLLDGSLPLFESVNNKMIFDEIKTNGYSKQEKDVFSLLLDGHTVREAGKRLGVSHVMIVKIKNRLIKKWRKKNTGYQK